MSLGKFVVYLAAVFFLIYGLAFCLVPVGMALLVTDSEPEGVSALIDFRATYGGMTLALGIALLYLDYIKQLRAGLIIVVIVLLSMAASRTLGFFVHGSGNFIMYLYLALEVLGSALAMVAIRGRSRAA